MTTHLDCTCCRHWRAVTQPTAADAPIPYYLADDWSPKDVADAIAQGRQVRLLPPRLPPRSA